MTEKIIIAILTFVVVLIAGLSLINYYSSKNQTSKTGQNIPGGQVAVLGTSLINQDINMPENNIASSTQAIIKTNLGNITVKFYTEDAPKTVANFIKLASAGFYDSVKFHRVIKDFMIQSGDPLSKDDAQKSKWGTGGPGYEFEDEINSHKLVKGSLAMANSGADTNGSQFFIVTAAATSWLDGKHTNFGEVISGLDIVGLIGNAKTDSLDRPVENIVINSVELK